MKIKRTIFFSVVILLIMFAVVAVGLSRGFDASGYVQAMLDLTFQGETDAAMDYIRDTDSDELYEQYEDGIESLVEDVLSAEVELEEKIEDQYKKVTRDILKSMKYEVGEAEKVSKNEYRVPVTYRSSNVYELFVTEIQDEILALQSKVEKGEYQGDDEQIFAQMQTEVLTKAPEHLKTAYENMEYAEKESMIFVVEKNEDGVFAVKDTQIHEFVLKILGLDEIQG